MIAFLTLLNFSILVFFIFLASIYTLLLIGAFPRVLNFFTRSQRTNLEKLLNTKELPPVTILTACHNEEEMIIDNVWASLNSKYKNIFVIVINDGSTDRSLEKLKKTFKLKREPVTFELKIKTAKIKNLYLSKTQPNLMVIDKEQSGLADSLNVGLNACFTTYLMLVDGDSIVAPNAVSELMYELLISPFAIGVGGGVYILNSSKYKHGEILEPRMPYRFIPGFQANEYLRSHLFSRTGWNRFGATMCYSGTSSLYNANLIKEIHGFDRDNYSPDAEVVIHLHHYMHLKKRPYKIRFTPSAAVWTDVPKTVREFTNQRNRWQRGILRSVLKHWRMFLNPKYGIQGLFSYPVYILLEVAAPLVEFVAYLSVLTSYCLGILNGSMVLLYVLLAWGFLAYVTVANMFMNLITFNQYRNINDIFWMFSLAILEMFGFRLYHTLVKTWGTVHYFINRILGKPL